MRSNLLRWLGRISGYAEKLRLADAATEEQRRRVVCLEALVRKKERLLDHWEAKREGAEERLDEADEAIKELTAEAQSGWQRVAVLEEEIKGTTAEYDREKIELGERIVRLSKESDQWKRGYELKSQELAEMTKRWEASLDSEIDYEKRIEAVRPLIDEIHRTLNTPRTELELARS